MMTTTERGMVFDRTSGFLGGGPGRVVVVLPAYNEESSIGDLIDLVAEVLDGAAITHHILVVDDGSTDGTAEIVASRRGRTSVELLVNERNLGLGGAVARGLRRAVEVARAGELAPVEGVRDYSCGYRLYDARVLAAAMDGHGPELITERGFAYTFEILVGLRGWARFREIPFVLHYDVKRKGSAIRILPTRLRVRRRRARRAEASTRGRASGRAARRRPRAPQEMMSSVSSRWSPSRARNCRAFTAPSVLPMAAAVSRMESSKKNRHSTTSR